MSDFTEKRLLSNACLILVRKFKWDNLNLKKLRLYNGKCQDGNWTLADVRSQFMLLYVSFGIYMKYTKMTSKFIIHECDANFKTNTFLGTLKVILYPFALRS